MPNLRLSEGGAAGVFLMLVLYLLVGLWLTGLKLPRTVKWMIWVGLGLRVVGVLGRMSIAADARVYFNWGLASSEQLSYFLDRGAWIRPQQSWPGTNFVGFTTAAVLTVLGPSWFGAFLAFALLALFGVAAFVWAFYRAFPGANAVKYWGWVLLFPSLWFWPSSIGKEAVLMLGLGLATLGFVGKMGRMNWAALTFGVGLLFAVRPEVVAVFLGAVLISHWVDFDRWNVKRFVQAVVILGVSLTGIRYAMASVGAGGFDIDRIEALVEYNAEQAAQGGSAIEVPGLGPAGALTAIVNVLFRPFIWEAHNAAALYSALELMAMWGIAWLRRRQIVLALRMWRRHRVLRFAVPFVVLYAAALGMNLTNLGIIARQRVLIFPFLFMVIEGGTMFLRRRRRPSRVVLPGSSTVKGPIAQASP